MDCNKEEALRVLDLAEKRFKDEDLEGAVKLALKAQKLFPSLCNLMQTITAYEVHLAAATKKLTTGQTDWHAVLRVDPSADYNTIKKQFKNMCLLTHPDKNRRSTAADGAFKIVMKAWSMLSTGSSSSSRSSSSSSRSSSSSSTKPQKKPEDPKSPNWQYLYAKIRCEQCGLLLHWDFSCEPKDRDESLYHYCKSCSNWCVIRNRPARVEVPLACEGCDGKLRWGAYQALGYECTSCGSYYIVGVNPDWITKSQPCGAETNSFGPETVSCPYCGAWNSYQVDAAGNRAFVSCNVCGLRSIIELVSESSV